MDTQKPNNQNDRTRSALTLIVIGLFLLVGQLTGQWSWTMLILGLGFLGAFFWSRNYGWLVPGGILTGLGVGIVLNSTWRNPPDNFEAGMILVPLGLGFVLIWVLDVVFTRHSNAWPLIPGSILVLVGLAVGIGGMALDILNLAGQWWPLILILIGAWILFTVWREGGKERRL